MSRFEQAVSITLKHEGGYTWDPDDPGGETKFGISKRSYPDIDIKDLTQSQAVAIYKKDFWDKYGYNKITNDAVAFKLFDMSVNMGPSQAHKLIQRALKIKETGRLDTSTLASINSSSPSILYSNLTSAAESFYKKLPTFSKFGKGWLSRLYADRPKMVVAGFGGLGVILLAVGGYFVWRYYARRKHKV